MTDIIAAATQIFNPFVGVIALVLGVSLGVKLFQKVARMW